MKIFSAAQIKNGDLFTIKNEPIASVHLMEKAAMACTDFIHHKYLKTQNILIFCGNGNNGGDGLAMARLLYQKGFDVDVFMDKSKKELSKDAEINYHRLKEFLGIRILDFTDFNESFINEDSIIVDALFGTGLNRKIEGEIAKIILKLNPIHVHKIAIDIPSGVLADGNIPENAVVFKADETLSLQFCKKSFLHPEISEYCGKIHILEIGISKKYIENTETPHYIIDEEIVRKIYKKRKDTSHKGNYGKTCIVAGSFGKIGAAVLATKSALYSGSGLTYILAPKCGYEILQTTCPEAMYLYGGEDFIKNFTVENDFTYGIGPGLGTDYETEEKLMHFLKNYNEPLVLDADALNLISKNPENLNLIPKKSIITPHPKEFSRLFGESKDSFERLELAKSKAKELNIYIVLKGHHTQIITPEGNVFYNITGNSGLAKGGSGDVLLGIITSFLAQGYSPENAAIFGVWLHGKAADFTAEKYSKEAMLASDVIQHIGEVFKFLQK